MTLEGFQLQQALRKQHTVEVRDGRGRRRRTVETGKAIDLCVHGSFIGIVSADGIRYIRPIEAPKGGIIAEDCITTVGSRAEQRGHHVKHCNSYGPHYRRTTT